jgi:hypothetical protein
MCCWRCRGRFSWRGSLGWRKPVNSESASRGYVRILLQMILYKRGFGTSFEYLEHQHRFSPNHHVQPCYSLLSRLSGKLGPTRISRS